MEKPDALLSEALREVDWINVGRTLDSLVRGVEWDRYDKNFIKPNFEKALNSLSWMVDNVEELAKLFEQYEAEAKEKRKLGPRRQNAGSKGSGEEGS